MEYDSAGSVRELQANLFPPIVPRNTNSVGENINIPSILIAPRFDSTLQTNFTNRNDKIKEPRDLFEIPSHSARWPVECQVLHERVEHIEYTPPTPEPYYESSESDPTPPPIGEGGTIVFNYHPISPVCYYSRSTIGGSRPITPSSLERNCLHFESRFESGNLAKAVRITENYYELYLRADMYTNRHQQWFYFKISNTRRSTTYRLSIVNLAKADSLYNEGMRPLLYSSRDARLHSIGWRRCGNNIAYYQNEIPPEETDDSATYTLSFTIEFPHDRDDVYIAHCYPYTYTDLQEYLTRIATHPVKSTFSTLRLLCRSLAGNNIYYLTITSPSSIFPSTPDVQRPKKRAIVLTARVHPGESPSSWMMKGMIDFLTGDSNPARELREKFIFKLIPMLNPDGVIVGNSRCSLTGRDLNRQYRTVIRETYPSVWHTKLMIRRLIEECGVAMYCDLHAHSRKHNIFMYGCETKRHSESKLQEQVFPLMLHKNSPDKFSFEDCKFRIQRSKEGTGRVVIWLLGVANSYTLEASFGGSQIGSRTTTHFTTQDYEAIGKSFCETLLDFSDDHPNKEKLRMKIVTKLLKGGSSADEPTNITLSDYSSDEGDTSSSDSEERLDCRFTSMQAPPPSPMPPKRTSRKTKPARIKAGRSPKLQREILPTLDWPTTDPGSDYYDSADERLGVLPTKRLGRTRTRYGDGFRSDWEHMPPELTIISNLENKTFNGRSQSVIDLGMAERRNKPSWHRLRSLPPPNRHTKPQPSEVQVKLTSLRQRIWTGISLNRDSPISWGLSVLAATAYQNDCEALLKSCSQKLFAFKKQNDSSKKNGLGQTKIKKKVKVVKSHTVDEVTTQKEKNNNKKPQKLKRQKAVTEVKIEPAKPDKIPIRSSTSMTNSRKLIKQKPVMNSIEKESDNEETINKRTVKKKKKRKKNAS